MPAKIQSCHRHLFSNGKDNILLNDQAEKQDNLPMKEIKTRF